MPSHKLSEHMREFTDDALMFGEGGSNRDQRMQIIVPAANVQWRELGGMPTSERNRRAADFALDSGRYVDLRCRFQRSRTPFN